MPKKWDYNKDIIQYNISIKNRLRNITTYRSYDCELYKKHIIIKKFLEDNFIPSNFSKAYIKNRSIYHNALSHMYNDIFLMLDIKSFFQNISHNKLINALYYELNKINKNQISMFECKHLLNICSPTQNKGIPIGFITSPILSNIYLKEFDHILYGKLKGLNLKNIIYTRYADDITISYKDTDNFNDVKSITHIINDILSRFSLYLNHKKTRYYSLAKSNHIKITGVNIIKYSDNYRKLTIGKKLKNELYHKAVYMYKNHIPDFNRELRGTLSFILSIEKTGFEQCYSNNMINYIHSLGFESLKQLIESL